MQRFVKSCVYEVRKMQKTIDIHHPLVEKCKQGDAKAQFELYKLHARYMYNVACNLLRHSAEAEDVVQEAFLSAFEKMDTFIGEVNFATWLKRIVVNKALDMLRRRKELQEIGSIEHRLASEEEHEKEYDERLFPFVEECLGRLATGYRTVVTLYLIEGYDHSEISEILGISEVASRTQYIRGKKRLAALLEEKRILVENG